MVLRQTYGRLLGILGRCYQPKMVHRTAQAQDSVDRETVSMVIYGYDSCPYCFKVNREIERLALRIQAKDIKRCETYRYELLTDGGKAQVPCLKFLNKDGKEKWLYESDAIVGFLKERFDPMTTKAPKGGVSQNETQRVTKKAAC